MGMLFYRSGSMVFRSILPVAAIAALSLPASVHPMSGRLGTLPHGTYVCSLPGDAGGPAWRVVDDRQFTIINASSYRNSAGSGTYLLTGKQVAFTRGPMKGTRFDRNGKSSLQLLDKNGQPDRIRCVRGPVAR